MDRAVKAGVVSQERADMAKAAYERDEATFGPQVASERVASEAEHLAAEKLRRAELQAKSQLEIMARIEAGSTMKELVENHHGARGKTLAGRHEAYRSILRAGMNKILREFRSDVAGRRRNKAQLRLMLKELFGEDTGNKSARELAQAWRATAEDARQRFNRMGGSIGQRRDWGLPQMHEQIKVSRVAAAEWADLVTSLIDRSKMRDDAGRPISDADLRDTLLEMHEQIATGGWSKMEPAKGGDMNMGARRGDITFLPFNDADAWMKYNEAFGSDDPWRVMVSHIDDMAHQIAHMDVLGPNPNATWKFAEEVSERQAGLTKDPKVIRRAKHDRQAAETMRENWSGATQSGSDRMFARAMSSTRQYLSASYLGRAVFSSVSDLNTARVSAGFMGLSKVAPMKNLTKLMASDEFRNFATEGGMILENAVDTGMAAQRYTMEDYHSEVAGRLVDGVLRSTGLSGLTQMQRDAFGMTVMEGFASLRKSGWDTLPRNSRESLESYGINAAVWDKIRSAEVATFKGVDFLRPKEIEAVAGLDAAMNFMEMIIGNREFAVPSSSIRAKAALNDKARPGTIGGEVIKSIAQFKGHPIMMVFTHVARIVDMATKGRKKDAVTYALGLFIGNTILGMVSMQLKALSKGEDPLDMTDPKVWAAAAAQGGGIGIFGDFLFADQNRFGGSVGQTLSGPTVGFASDVMSLTIGNAQQAIAGEETNILGEAVDFATSNNPLSSIWWASLAFEREIADQLMLMADPDAARGLSQQDRRAERDKSGYFWRPGQSVLQGDAINAPDFAEAIGG